MDPLKNQAETQVRLTLNKWRLWVFPAGVLAFVAATALLVIMPQISKLVALREEVQKAEQKLQRLVKKRTFLTTVSQEGLDDQVALAVRLLPNSKPVFEAMLAFEGLASDLGVVVSEYSLNPGRLEADEKSSGSKLAQLPIKLTVEGDLTALNSFVTQLEYMAPLIQVEKLQASRLRSQKENATHSSEIDVLVLYSEVPTSMGKTSDALIELSADKKKLLDSLLTYAAYEQLAPAITASPGGLFRENIFTY